MSPPGHKLSKGLKTLSKKDADIARAIETAGPPAPRQLETGIATLLRIIIDQQVSVHAGRAIWKRLEEGLSGDVSAKSILKAGDEKLKSCGLSRPKARYALCLADAVEQGTLDLEALPGMSDDDVNKQLTAITGIGRWTADIYSMFALGREDIWPSGDLAVAEATKRLLGLEARPTPAELDIIGERWQPWRSEVAILLWHYYKRVPAL